MYNKTSWRLSPPQRFNGALGRNCWARWVQAQETRVWSVPPHGICACTHSAQRTPPQKLPWNLCGGKSHDGVPFISILMNDTHLLSTDLHRQPGTRPCCHICCHFRHTLHKWTLCMFYHSCQSRTWGTVPDMVLCPLVSYNPLPERFLSFLKSLHRKQYLR